MSELEQNRVALKRADFLVLVIRLINHSAWQKLHFLHVGQRGMIPHETQKSSLFISTSCPASWQMRHTCWTGQFSNSSFTSIWPGVSFASDIIGLRERVCGTCSEMTDRTRSNWGVLCRTFSNKDVDFPCFGVLCLTFGLATFRRILRVLKR